jgi:hypothetical protein
MKHKLLTAVMALTVTFSASGCSMFYPTPEPTPTQTETPTPTPTDKPTPTVDPNLNKVQLNVLNSSAFRDNGTIEVIVEALEILEEDGKCTLKVTQGDLSQSVTVNAEPNVTSTQCFPMEIPIGDFKDGKVTFTVHYISSKSAGLLNSQTLVIE